MGYINTNDPKLAAFIADIDAVCVKHGLTFSHEDGGGAFIIEHGDESPFSENNTYDERQPESKVKVPSGYGSKWPR